MFAGYYSSKTLPLSSYEGNFYIYHFEETAASIKRRQSGRQLLRNSDFRLLYAFYPTTSSLLYVIWCNRKEKKTTGIGFSFNNRFNNLIAPEIQLWLAWSGWTRFSVTWLYFYMPLCWHRRFEPSLSLRQKPPPGLWSCSNRVSTPAVWYMLPAWSPT